MSLFLGKHNNKPLLHSTRNEQSEEQLTAGPNKDTIFHSDLPYILVHDRIDVPMKNSVKTLTTKGLGGNTPPTSETKIVVPEGIIPQKIRDYISQGLAYVIVVHRNGRQYTVQPQLSIEPGGLNTFTMYSLLLGGLPQASWGSGSDRLTFTESSDFPNYSYAPLTLSSICMDITRDMLYPKLLHDHSLSSRSRKVQWWGSTSIDPWGPREPLPWKGLFPDIENPSAPDKLEFIFFKVKKTSKGLVKLVNTSKDVEVDNKTFRVGDVNILDQEYLVVGSENEVSKSYVQPLYGMPKGNLRTSYIDKIAFWEGTSKFRVPIQTCSYTYFIRSGYGPGTPNGYYQNGHHVDIDVLYNRKTANRIGGPQRYLITNIDVPKFSIVSSKSATGVRLRNDNIIISTNDEDIDLFTKGFKPRFVVKGYNKISTSSVDFQKIGIGSSRRLKANVIRRKVGTSNANLGPGKSACIAYIRLNGERMLNLEVSGKYSRSTSLDVYSNRETDGMCGLLEFEEGKEIVVCSYTARAAAAGGFSGEDGQFHFGVRGIISLQKNGSSIDVYNTLYTAIKNWGIWSASFTVNRIQVPGIEITLSELY